MPHTSNSGSFKKGFSPWNKGTGEMSKPKVCLYCNGEFYSRVPTRKFCSPKCSQLFPISEKTREKHRKYMIANPVKYWLGKNNPHATGKNNNNWNGGKTSRAGYTFTLSPNHPNRNNENYVRDSRLVVEKILGRYLLPTEIIHHINKIRNDNRPENLYLFSNKSKHSQYHMLLNSPTLISNLSKIN